MSHFFRPIPVGLGLRSASCLFALRLAFSLSAGESLTSEEKEGKEFAMRLAAGRPEQSFTNQAVLRIRDGAGRREPLIVQITTHLESDIDWVVTYQTVGAATPSLIRIRHHGADSPLYEGAGRDEAFAGSDFTGRDLALEFFHWPNQRMIHRDKPEMRKGRPCRILESSTPETSSPYVRVRSWIDLEHLQPLIAEAYDARGNLVKEFTVGSVRKVEGVWQLKDLEMLGEKSGTQTKLEFQFIHAHGR